MKIFQNNQDLNLPRNGQCRSMQVLGPFEILLSPQQMDLIQVVISQLSVQNQSHRLVEVCIKHFYISQKITIVDHEHNTRLLESCSKCCSGRRRPLIAIKGNSSHLEISTVFIVGDHKKLIPKMSRAVCACLPATPNSLTYPGGATIYIESINPTSSIILQAILFCDASHQKNPCNVH